MYIKNDKLSAIIFISPAATVCMYVCNISPLFFYIQFIKLFWIRRMQINTIQFSNWSCYTVFYSLCFILNMNLTL